MTRPTFVDDDRFAVQLPRPTGALIVSAVATLSQTRHNPRGYDIRMEVIGSKDSVAMGLGPQAPIRSTEPGAPQPKDPWSTFLTRFESAYRAELLAFLRVARGEIPSPCSPREASEAMRIANGHLDYMDYLLDHRRWLAGASLSLADFNLMERVWLAAPEAFLGKPRFKLGEAPEQIGHAACHRHRGPDVASGGRRP